MVTFALYLGKSALWITGFALIYFLFLRNERFFTLKRIYLITGIIASLVFPLVSFNYTVEVPAVQQVVSDMNFTSALPERIPDVQQAVNKGSIKPDISMIILIVYLSGLLFLLVRMLKQAGLMLKKIRMSKIEDIGYARLVRTPEFSMSFSFFNYIFINPSMNNSQMEPVMKHELVHVRQKHWLDLIVAETFCLFQWMNPFTWMYSRYIRQNHEYIADQAVLQDSADPAFYKAILLNQMFDSQVICLSNSFNYSLNKTRFDMMKTIISSPWRKLKILWVIPFIAIVFYAFAIPEYRYISADNTSIEPLTIYEPTLIVQNQVKGIVLNEEGKPLSGVNVTATGTIGRAQGVSTGPDGRFILTDIEANASLGFFSRGYKGQEVKADFNNEMKIILIRDPDYKEPVYETKTDASKSKPIVVLDDVITDQPAAVLISKLGDDIGTIKSLRGQEATDKYGDAGKYGVTEIYTKKKAAELGIKIPFRRRNPEDFPTFQGGRASSFNAWVVSQIEYPAEALTNGIQGRISINYTVESDGSVSNVSVMGKSDPLLGDAAVKAIRSSPRWEPAVNTAAREPFSSMLSIKFALADKRITEDDTYVVVEQMPMYPGGPEMLLNFITSNLKYPETARADGIQGRVIVRFIVNKEGAVEEAIILKGVNPELDKEAIRVISSLSGFKPGSQNGEPVNVYYMVPVNFALSDGTKPLNP